MIVKTCALAVLVLAAVGEGLTCKKGYRVCPEYASNLCAKSAAAAGGARPATT